MTDKSMPRPTMTGGAREQPNGGAALPRFPSPHGAGGSRFEPGAVEVQFRAGLMPRVTAGGPGQPPSLTAGVPFDTVNQLLLRYQAVGAEPTFAGAAEEGASYKDDFITLHFPAGANLEEIAAQLNQLQEVERAVPLPSALPPHPG
jgi:hypothetical protein